MGKLSFRGHDTFHCRHFWLKKGVDYILAQKSFTADTAVLDLGVGKNMVTSIRFWLRSFNLLKYNKENKREDLSFFAEKIFADNGFDPYLEDITSIWLLHYYLITSNKASIYSLVFNVFRKERVEFTRENLLDFLVRLHLQRGISYNENTLKKDINVFFRNYLAVTGNEKGNIEDDFSALLIELNLLKEIQRTGHKYKWYSIESANRNNIPAEIILFSILDNPDYANSTSISFTSLLNDNNSIGSIYALTPQGLINKIEEMLQLYPFLVYTDDAGIRELQFKTKPNKWEILTNYYAK